MSGLKFWPKKLWVQIPCPRSPPDAQVIFHAVAVGVLPMVTRRLDTEERRAITSGSVFVWEERGPNPEATGVSTLVKPPPVISQTESS